MTIVVCPCGRKSQSEELRTVGFQDLFDGTSARLVNCACGSTIVASILSARERAYAEAMAVKPSWPDVRRTYRTPLR